MSKIILRHGHKLIKCPVCNANTFDYVSYSEYGWGTVEQHGNCQRCGYFVEQCYSDTVEGIMDTFKGYKDHKGIYHPRNMRKHKRIRRQLNLKNIPVNLPEFSYL